MGEGDFVVELPAGPLGLSLQQTHDFPDACGYAVQIDEVLVDGQAAKLAPEIKPGDVIVSINGATVKGSSFKETTSVLQLASRPLTLEMARHELAQAQDKDKKSNVAKQDIYSITFEEKQLGMALQPLPSLQQEVVRFRVQVDGVVDGTAAHKSQKIEPGHLITHINDESLENLTYEEATQKLTDSDRPLTLRFLPHIHRPAGTMAQPSNRGKDGPNKPSLNPRVIEKLRRKALQERMRQLEKQEEKSGWNPFGWRLVLLQMAIVVLVSLAMALYPRLEQMAARASLL